MTRDDGRDMVSELRRLVCAAAVLGGLGVAPALMKPADAAFGGAAPAPAAASARQTSGPQPRAVQARIDQAWRTELAADPEARPNPADLAAAR